MSKVASRAVGHLLSWLILFQILTELKMQSEA